MLYQIDHTVVASNDKSCRLSLRMFHLLLLLWSALLFLFAQKVPPLTVAVGDELTVTCDVAVHYMGLYQNYKVTYNVRC
jgi:hypothetical protein